MTGSDLILCLGDYEVAIKYHDHPIAGSPFTALAWDHRKVFVSNIRPGHVHQETKFDSGFSEAYHYVAFSLLQCVANFDRLDLYDVNFINLIFVMIFVCIC